MFLDGLGKRDSVETQKTKKSWVVSSCGLSEGLQSGGKIFPKFLHI